MRINRMATLATTATAITAIGLGLTACGASSTPGASPAADPAGLPAAPTVVTETVNVGGPVVPAAGPAPVVEPAGNGGGSGGGTPAPSPVSQPPAIQWINVDYACWQMPTHVSIQISTVRGPVALTGTATYWQGFGPHGLFGVTAPVTVTQQNSSTFDGVSTVTFDGLLPVNTLHPMSVAGSFTATDASGAHVTRTFSVSVHPACIV